MDSYSRRSFAIAVITLLASACGGPTVAVPTAPSDRPVFVRLSVNPPTIQATSAADGWNARWNLLLEAATEYPDSTNVMAFAAQPVAIESVQSILTAADGRVLADVTHTAAEIRAANGSNELTSARPPLVRRCCTVSEDVSYSTPIEPPSMSALRIVIQLRDSRGSRQQFIRMSSVYEAICGYKGGPTCR